MKKLFYILIIFFLICLSCTISTEESSNCTGEDINGEEFSGNLDTLCEMTTDRELILVQNSIEKVLCHFKNLVELSILGLNLKY